LTNKKQNLTHLTENRAVTK